MPRLSRALHRHLAFFIAGVMLVCSFTAQAANPNIPASRITLHHTSWLPKDGAPSYVTALAQTRDGWLWVGSSVGLYRFDGVRFELFSPPGTQLPSSYVRSLSVLPDGSLWVGYHYGGISEIRDGRVVHHYPSRKGGLQGSIYGVAIDAQGQVWAGGIAGLYQLKGGEFLPAPSALAPPGSAIQLLPDSTGGFWVRSGQGVYYRAAGTSKFELMPGDWGWGNLVEAGDGSVWGSDTAQGGVRMLRGPANGAAPQVWRTQPGPNSQLAFDKSGRLWTLRADGVEMLRPGTGPDLAQQLGLQQGLSGESGTALLVDREGNIWVGSDGGLDRFRENKLTRYRAQASQGEALPLAAGKDGAIWTDRQWIGDVTAAPQLFDRAPPSATNFSMVEYVDSQGRLWTHTLDGLSRVEKTGQGFTRTVIPPPDKAMRAQAHGLGMDREGNLWATFGPQLFRLKDGQWLRNGGYDELGKKGYTTLYTDPYGGLWFGATQNILLTLADGKVRRFDEKDGIELGTVTQFYSDGKTLWASGENGLAFFDGKRFHMVRGQDDEPFLSTSGMTRSEEGDLWLNSGRGIFRIPSQEHARWLVEPAYRARFSRLGHEDGLLGAAPQTGGIRSAMAAQGKLWFSTTTGLFWIDPRKTLHNDLVPPVVIKSVQVNHTSYQPQANLALPAGTRQLSVDYTALSLTLPERMQFRYRLEGFDTDWQPADNRRTAFYTNLGPGNYRFQVQASNNDGVWNETGATLAFSIKPTVLQTSWFRGAVVLLLALAIWLLHRWRLSQMAGRMREKLDERLDERERIARELHDTLLQSVHGLVLVIDKAVKRITAPAEREMIERALEKAEAVIEEGRDRVHGLRHGASDGELFEALRQFGDSLPEAGAVTYRASMIGEPRPLLAIVNEECQAIAKEAISNAFHHAGATGVELQLQYGVSELRLTIRDDGCGIPADVQQAGGREGHWGLLGMQERAGKIRAKLECRSSAGEGTVWQLSIPAQLAYVHTGRGAFWRSLLLWGERYAPEEGQNQPRK